MPIISSIVYSIICTYSEVRVITDLVIDKPIDFMNLEFFESLLRMNCIKYFASFV